MIPLNIAYHPSQLFKILLVQKWEELNDPQMEFTNHVSSTPPKNQSAATKDLSYEVEFLFFQC